MPDISLDQVIPTAVYPKPVVDLIQERFSCRTYHREMIDSDTQSQLVRFVSAEKRGPFGHTARFQLVAASEQDPQRLRYLGTYGFIQGASGFLVGAMPGNQFSPEDYGYLMEQIILYATSLGLGTCWLGGTFTKSSFARKINAREDEVVPAVSAVGYIAEYPRRIETWLKARRGPKRRLPWTSLFFDQEFGQPLSTAAAGDYKTALEMVRIAPSASNRQPWRVVKDNHQFHFFLQRTPGYRDRLLVRMTTVADLQRMDMGIAMSHFELAAREAGLRGRWVVDQSQLDLPDPHTEYTASWVGGI